MAEIPSLASTVSARGDVEEMIALAIPDVLCGVLYTAQFRGGGSV
jgi:hypothetical protein